MPSKYRDILHQCIELRCAIHAHNRNPASRRKMMEWRDKLDDIIADLRLLEEGL